MSADSLQLHREHADHMTEGQANEIIEKFDKNNDSVLNKHELTDLIHNNQGSKQVEAKKDVVSNKAQKAPARVAVADEESKMKLSRSQIKEIFMEHDIDGDGFLNVSELTMAFSFLGSIIPLYKAHYGLAYADANGDGLVSEEELDKLIDYAEKINRKKKSF